jgi:hypothetical protein
MILLKADITCRDQSNMNQGMKAVGYAVIHTGQ